MSQVEKAKKNKKRKKTSKKKSAKKKNAKTETEVLERVMGSIEMAGASMDFFEEESVDSAVEQDPADVENIETLEALASEEPVEAESQTQEEIEAFAESEIDDGENLELLDADTDPESSIDENSENFVEQKQAFSILESLLFSSDRPLGLGTFKQVFKGTNFKSKDIKKALVELQSEYADVSRGVTLEEINGGWQLRTKVDNMDFLRKLAKARPFKLSGPALEVLAIIAYKQPLIKSEVDDIRGVESGHLVRALMDKSLVCFQGRSELPGKPMQYGTTRKFLEIFGLRNLRELPSLDEIDQLLPDGIGVEDDDPTLSDVTDSMSENYEGNYSEGEEELLKIENTLEGIDTSSEFFEEEKRRQREKRDRDRATDIREALDVGEAVEAKDQKWLERYDKKMEELKAQEEASEATIDDSATVEILNPNVNEVLSAQEDDLVAEPELNSLGMDSSSESENSSVLEPDSQKSNSVELAAEVVVTDDEGDEPSLSQSLESLTEESDEVHHEFDPFEDDDQGSGFDL